MGTAFRALDPRWSFKPLSGEGAALFGGRFNPKGMLALYLALDDVTAIKEASQGFGAKFEPLFVCAYEIDCVGIVDLRQARSQKRRHIHEGQLASGWKEIEAEGDEPPTWAMARRMTAQGVTGIIVPSFARRAVPGESNLVLWRWGPKRPRKVEVFDPSGRLPKNDLSWS